MAETNIVTSVTLANDQIPLVIRERLLMLAEKQLVFYEIGDKESLPENSGKTMQFTRYERLPLPTSPLTESETPTATPLNASVVQAVVEQWGAVVSMSDVAQLTIRHPVLRVAQQRLSTQHTETVDREIQKVLMGSSNVSFANNRASASALVAGDVFISDDCRRAVSTLRANGAPGYEGDLYVGVLDPYVEMDITKNSDFLQAAQYQNLRALMNNEIGTWMGVRWKRSNFIPIVTLLSAGATISANTTLNNFTGFAAGSTVKVKVTRLDANTGFETAIGNETDVTNVAAFRVQVQLTVDGIYNIYVSLENGAAGTATFQARFTRSGTTITVNIAKGLGTGTITTTELVVTATGSIAPPDTSSAGNVHTIYIFGKESFGVIDLAGLTTTLTPATASDSDPLVQRRKAGWKQMWKAVIKNTAFFRRIQALSDFN